MRKETWQDDCAITLKKMWRIKYIHVHPLLLETLSSGQRQRKKLTSVWTLNRYQSWVQQRKQKPIVCKGKHLKAEETAAQGTCETKEGGKQDRFQIHLRKGQPARTLPHPMQPGNWTICTQKEIERSFLKEVKLQGHQARRWGEPRQLTSWFSALRWWKVCKLNCPTLTRWKVQSPILCFHSVPVTTAARFIAPGGKLKSPSHKKKTDQFARKTHRHWHPGIL